MKKRRTYKDIIAEIGITLELFLFYVELFTKRKFPYMWWSDKIEDWIRVNFTLGKSTIAQHLKEECIVGSFGNRTTSHFILDLDFRKKAGEDELWERLHKIRSLFPHGVAIQSSSSKGIHYYVFLEDEYPIDDVRNLVKARLLRNGIEPKDGYVEIFPQMEKGLRCPFGRDSGLINLDDCTATTSKYEDIYGIQNCTDWVPIEEVFDDGDYSVASNIEYYQTKTTSPHSEHITTHSSSHINTFILGSVSNFTDPFSTECLWYLENGIQEEGTRNELVYKLVFFLMKLCNLSASQTHEIMEKWLEEKNNGRSELWIDKPDGVLRKLEAQINWMDKKESARWHNLSLLEVSSIFILQLPFKDSWFLFDLNKFLKTHADKDGFVYIPRNLLWTMKGCCHRTYQARVALAIAHGFIEKVGNYTRPTDDEDGVPTRYRALLPLDRANRQFGDFPKAAALILGKEEFIRRWGKYHWHKYVESNATTGQSEGDSYL